jgi:hypothetical protein
LAGIGLYTALASAAVARTRADRKGALACVASVFLRLGLLFFWILAFWWLLALGLDEAIRSHRDH